jgi:predicted GH43/DUF377 family glycosyl hydrolase
MSLVSEVLVPKETDVMFEKGLVLGVSSQPRCDDFRLGGAVVRWDEQVSCWRMWYYCRSSGFPAGMAPAFGTGTIATALSQDGISWQRVDGPLQGGAVMGPCLDANAFDSTHVATGDVIWQDGRWLMVYFGGSQEIPQGTKALYASPGYLLRLGLAESPDGVHWTRITGDKAGGAIVDVDAGQVYAAFPGIVSLDNGFLVHYTTVDKLGRFHNSHVVTSTDLERWVPAKGFEFAADPLLHETAGIVTRDILPNPTDAPGKWLMVYTARDGRPETDERRAICAAVSDDLVRWEHLSRQPFFTVGRQGAWDSAGVATARLVVTPDDMRLYYYGWSNASYEGHPGRGIGCAISPGRQLHSFRRV